MTHRLMILRAKFPAALLVWITLFGLVASTLTGCGDGGDDGSTQTQSILPDIPTEEREAQLALLPQPEMLRLSIPGVRALAYHPAGRWLAVAGDGGIWLYTVDLRPVRFVGQHDDTVLTVAWSPDGIRLASGGLDHTVRIWDAANGEELAVLKGHKDTVITVAWSPDGTQIASAGKDQTIRLWDADTGEQISTLTGHENWITAVAWSPDGTQIASASTDQTVRLWDTANSDSPVVLGAYELEGVLFRLEDHDTIDTIRQLIKAEEALARLDGEPFTDLVAALHNTSFSVAFTFADEQTTDLIRTLQGRPLSLAIQVKDDALRQELNALDDAQVLDLIRALVDQGTIRDLDALAAAEQTIEEIYARDDIDMIELVRQLEFQEAMVFIRQDEEGTIVRELDDETLFATLAALDDETFSLSIELKGEQAIIDKLADPAFIEAVIQLQEAENVISDFDVREDAGLLRVARQLRVADYTLAIKSPDTAVADQLAALDNEAIIDLIALLQDEDLVQYVTSLQDIGYGAYNDLRGDSHFNDVINRLQDNKLVSKLKGVGFSVALEVADDDLAARLAALKDEDRLKLLYLLKDKEFIKTLEQRDDTKNTLDEIKARDDIDLINTLRELETKDGTFELEVEIKDAVLVENLSARDDDAVMAFFHDLEPDDFASRLDDGSLAIPRAVSPDMFLEIVRRLKEDDFSLSVMREDNGHSDSVTVLAWSPDGNQLASGSADKTVRLWDTASGALLLTLEEHKDGITALAWSPDGMRLATGSWDKTIRLWNMADGEELARFEDHEDAITALVWPPDAALLISSSRDGTIRVWDLGTRLAGHTEPITALDWSPEEYRMVSGSLDGTVRLWNARSGHPATLPGHEGAVLAVAWSPDGTRIASGGADGILRLWDAASGAGRGILAGHEETITAVRWSPDGALVASASTDGTVRLWDAASGEPLIVLPNQPTDLADSAPSDGAAADSTAVPLVAWSPDGTQIAASSPADHAVRVWDAASGELLLLLEGHRAGIRVLAWSPDGTQIVTGSEDRTARLWDAASGELIAVLRKHMAPVTAAVWSPDGTQIVTASEDRTARLWDAASAKEVALLEGYEESIMGETNILTHKDSVTGAEWSPDGARIATASADGTIRLWDTASHEQIARLEGPGKPLQGVLWSPDGTHLAAIAGLDIWVWGQ